MKLLVVVDFQNDFVNGAFGFAGAEALDERIAEKIKIYHENNDQVIFTVDTHHSNYLNTFEGKNLPVAHCIKNTEGHKLYGKAALEARITIFDLKKILFPLLILLIILKEKYMKALN